jgi:hypothetical protein
MGFHISKSLIDECVNVTVDTLSVHVVAAAINCNRDLTQILELGSRATWVIRQQAHRGQASAIGMTQDAALIILGMLNGFCDYIQF